MFQGPRVLFFFFCFYVQLLQVTISEWGKKLRGGPFALNLPLGGIQSKSSPTRTRCTSYYFFAKHTRRRVKVLNSSILFYPKTFPCCTSN